MPGNNRYPSAATSWLARFGAIAAVATALAACTAFRPEPKVCPPVSVLPEAASLTLFKSGPGRDPIDVAYEGEVAGIRVDCDRPDGQAVDTAVSLALVVRRGPAADPVQPVNAELPYFVAVVDAGGVIREKAVFRTSAGFAKGAPMAGVREDLDVTVKLEQGESPLDVGIMVGFQLTPEQLDYNRRR